MSMLLLKLNILLCLCDMKLVYVPPFLSALMLFGSQLWDINMDSGPVTTFQVHEYLRPKVRFLNSNQRVNM